jgi:hypothetical protein
MFGFLALRVLRASSSKSSNVLMMIVDDNKNMNGTKRNNLLNPELKYIGINSTFIGRNFVAYFSFSK